MGGVGSGGLGLAGFLDLESDGSDGQVLLDLGTA